MAHTHAPAPEIRADAETDIDIDPTPDTDTETDPTNHPDNRAEDGYPLGLPVPVKSLSAATVAAVARRHNLWTPKKMRRFLEVLAQSCSVTDAANAVGMSRQAAYRLRARLAGQPFDSAWEAAFEFGMQQLAHAALDRALHGVEEPIFHEAQQVGTRTRFDERLTMFLLANPARVGRHPLRRERMLYQWDDLLTLVEKGPLTWAEIEAAAGKKAKLSQRDEEKAKARTREFYDQQSHHAETARAELERTEQKARAAAPQRGHPYNHGRY